MHISHNSPWQIWYLWKHLCHGWNSYKIMWVGTVLHIATSNVIDGMTGRFRRVTSLRQTFFFLWHITLWCFFQRCRRTDVWQVHDNGKKATHYLCIAPPAAFLSDKPACVTTGWWQSVFFHSSAAVITFVQLSLLWPGTDTKKFLSWNRVAVWRQRSVHMCVFVLGRPVCPLL